MAWEFLRISLSETNEEFEGGIQMKRKLAAAIGLAMCISALGVPVFAGDEKPTVTLMIDITGFPALTNAVEMVREQFPEYEIVSKQWVYEDLRKVIKTTFAGDESVDISFSNLEILQSFADADMLLDLTPYLEEDTQWSSGIVDTAIKAVTMDGKVYGAPWQLPTQMMIANMDILDEVGITPDDSWKYDEWMDAAQKIKDAGYYPFAFGDTYGWVLGGAYLNAFDTEEELNRFSAGEISFLDERVVAAFDKAVNVFRNNYGYPGDGAFASSGDEAKAGFASGKVAFLATTNSSIAGVLDTVGIENYKLVSFPSFSNTDTNYLAASPDSFFICSNTKNEEAAVNVLKYLTSKDVMQMMAGYNVSVANKDIETDDELYKEISRDIYRVTPSNITLLSAEISDTLSLNALSGYYYDGEKVLETLDALREEAVNKNS